MKETYFVQVNDDMTPVRVELTETEVDTVKYVLEEIAKSNTDLLVSLSANDGTELYSNYDEWIKNDH